MIGDFEVELYRPMHWVNALDVGIEHRGGVGVVMSIVQPKVLHGVLFVVIIAQGGLAVLAHLRCGQWDGVGADVGAVEVLNAGLELAHMEPMLCVQIITIVQQITQRRDVVHLEEEVGAIGIIMSIMSQVGHNFLWAGE